MKRNKTKQNDLVECFMTSASIGHTQAAYYKTQ